MPQTILTITNERLQPYLNFGTAIRSNGKFAASKVFPTGCVIGRKTSDGLLYPCVTTNAIQTATASAAATAGTFTISVMRTTGVIGTTTALAYNASIATIQTALDIASAVVNGVVATSASSAAPMSTPTPLILTFSGTGFSALEQPLVTVDYSLLTGATVAVAEVEPNTVQTITLNSSMSAGQVMIGITRPNGVVGWTIPLAFNASLATVQTELDAASGITNGVVAATAGSVGPWTIATGMTLTYSGTGGYAGAIHPLAQIAPSGTVAGTNLTVITVDDTTITEDGTEIALGFNEFPFQTDASSICFLNTSGTTADMLAPGQSTMPYFIAGTFKITDLPGYRDRHLVDLGGRIIQAGIIRIP